MSLGRLGDSYNNSNIIITYYESEFVFSLPWTVTGSVCASKDIDLKILLANNVNKS